MTNNAQWQPIESAPRDGTSVLLFYTDWGTRNTEPSPGGHVYVGRFADGYWGDGDKGFAGKELTHWMPLPKAPAKSEGQDYA